MSEERLYVQNCPSCGVLFGIPKEMEPIWRESHHSFFCPNGHSLSWSGESPKDKEHRLRAKEVDDLKSELAKLKQELEAQKKRADELASELEIWRPTTAETKNGSDQIRGGDRTGQ